MYHCFLCFYIQVNYGACKLYDNKYTVNAPISARGAYLIFWVERGSLIQRGGLTCISIFKFWHQTNIVFISSKYNIQPILLKA